MEFDRRYKLLNAAQKRAVDSIEGPLVVIAGPGTGKTELLSMRAANILRLTDTPANSILCLTFTDSGASNMRSRLVDIIGPEGYKVAVHTFHNFGQEIINQNREFFYRGAQLRPADELTTYQVVRSIFDQLEPDNLLASKYGGQYVYLRDASSVISELKKSGLTSEELLAVINSNEEAAAHCEKLLGLGLNSGRFGKSTVETLAQVVHRINENVGQPRLSIIPSLSKVVKEGLVDALAAAEADKSTAPVRQWRDAWFKKNARGEFELKTRSRHAKLKIMAQIYFQYLSRMGELGVYDFDDMILQVIHTMEIRPELRFNLNEKYLYIMVDEFQDTNLAQMRLLSGLVSGPEHSDEPNLMVVGDDDQAIYGFQGANVSNTRTLLAMYPRAAIIPLTDNYRSAPAILAHAREVIIQGTARLEQDLEGIDKTLNPHLPDTPHNIRLLEFDSTLSERMRTAELIYQQVKSGTHASSIAVLARRHQDIMELFPYLARHGLRVDYDRQSNVLEEAPIKLLTDISSIVIALFRGNLREVDELLARTLAHPALGIGSDTIWRLSLMAREARTGWIETMPTFDELKPLHDWLLELARLENVTPLELTVDYIFGVTPVPDVPYISPIYEYYFAPSKLDDNPEAYVRLINGLTTLRRRSKDFHPEAAPTLRSLIEFIRLSQELGTTISPARPTADNSEQAIHLMTAHKSKGLEFDYVYIIGATDSVWGEGATGRTRIISYPENLPLEPGGNELDDRLRLFYVAMTRAKKGLHISYATHDETGRGLMKASFLADSSIPDEVMPPHPSIEEQHRQVEPLWYQPVIQPISQRKEELLRQRLSDYRLSFSDLSSYLDISRGGPQGFLVNNLLRFPQAPSPQAAYGTAIHEALGSANMHFVATDKHRPLEDILGDFEQALKRQPLSPTDYEVYLQFGSKVLTQFLNSVHQSFSPTAKAELSLANQHITIEGAHLTGKLDLVEFNGPVVIITDYKTGKPATSWQGREPYERLKLHRYRQQLAFYTLLLRHSRDWSKYTNTRVRLQFIEPDRSGEIRALDDTITNGELEEMTKLIGAVWKRIINLDFPDTSEYDQSLKGVVEFEKYVIDK